MQKQMSGDHYSYSFRPLLFGQMQNSNLIHYLAPKRIRCEYSVQAYSCRPNPFFGLLASVGANHCWVFQFHEQCLPLMNSLLLIATFMLKILRIRDHLFQVVIKFSSMSSVKCLLYRPTVDICSLIAASQHLISALSKIYSGALLTQPRLKKNLDSNVCSGQGLNLEPWHSSSRER